MSIISKFKSFYLFVILVFSWEICYAQSPEILSTVPLMNELNVEPNTSIMVTFNTNMNPGTINSSTIMVSAKFTGNHDCTFDYNTQTNTTTIDPLNDFLEGEIVTVCLTIGIESSQGTPLANSYLWSFTVLANEGMVEFNETVVSPLSSAPPTRLVTAYLNSDEYLDIAVSHENYDLVSVMIGNGDGSFYLEATYSTGSLPREIVAADLDNDGDMDLSTANIFSNDVSVLFNNGYGTFTEHVDYLVGDAPLSLNYQDFDGDGDLDMATANCNSDNVSIGINNGDGTFPVQHGFPVGSYPQSLTAGDFDNDADIDIATPNHSPDDNVSVLLNNGDATFAPHLTYPGGTWQRRGCTADFDNDGDMDLSYSNQNQNSFSIFINDGNGNFDTRLIYSTSEAPRYLFGGDLDGDGDMDVVTGGRESDINVQLNDGNAVFTSTCILNPANFLCIADFDLDNDLDIATVRENPDEIIVYLNKNVTGIEEMNQTPQEYSLSTNYPNPFNPSTKIKYQIPEMSFITIKVYDIFGREVATLVNEEKSAGRYEIVFDAANLSSGIYFYQIRVGDFVETKKMVLMK